MIEISIDEDLSHEAQFLMDMVLDVEKYHEFVPFCQSCVVRERSTKQGRDIMLAAMSVGVSFASETFVTRVISQRDEGSISVSGLDGPLKHLRNVWHIEDIGEGRSRVNFSVEFEFKSKILQQLARSKAENVCGRIMQAFIERADEIAARS